MSSIDIPFMPNDSRAAKALVAIASSNTLVFCLNNCGVSSVDGGLEPVELGGVRVQGPSIVGALPLLVLNLGTNVVSTEVGGKGPIGVYVNVHSDQEHLLCLLFCFGVENPANMLGVPDPKTGDSELLVPGVPKGELEPKAEPLKLFEGVEAATLAPAARVPEASDFWANEEGLDLLWGPVDVATAGGAGVSAVSGVGLNSRADLYLESHFAVRNSKSSGC